MSTISGGLSVLTTPRGGIAGAALGRERRRMTLSWTISPSALAECAPACVPGNGRAAPVRSAELTWSIEPVGEEGLSARAWVRLVSADGQTDDHPLTPPEGLACEVEECEDDQLTHISAWGVPGMPTFAVTTRGGAVLYAATDALFRLGLPGGVYDGPHIEPVYR